MKKTILVMCMLLMGGASFGACEVQCPEPYDLSHSVSQFFSTITGQKFISEKVGEKIIRKSVQKNITSGEIKTDIKSFSARDLKAGRFKSIEITGKDVNAQGIMISSFHAKTLCNFNYVTENKNGDVVVKENMPLAVKIVITEDDINKTMDSSDYKRLVDNINNIGGNFNIFQIDSTKVRLKDNKLYYTMKYTIPFVKKAKEIAFSADLRVENGDIKMANTTYENNSTSLDLNKFSKIINYINPLDFSAKILENRDAKFNIENVNISDKKVTIEGRMTVLKDKE